MIGRHIGVYEVEAQLGAGGMGEVYRARDTKLNRPVAIKFVASDFVDESAKRRFQQEARTASSLNHPHILTVHEAGEFDGRQYLQPLEVLLPHGSKRQPKRQASASLPGLWSREDKQPPVIALFVQRAKARTTPRLLILPEQPIEQLPPPSGSRASAGDNSSSYLSARSIPSALCQVSSYSRSGVESATMPPPTGN